MKKEEEIKLKEFQDIQEKHIRTKQEYHIKILLSDNEEEKKELKKKEEAVFELACNANYEIRRIVLSEGI